MGPAHRAQEWTLTQLCVTQLCVTRVWRRQVREADVPAGVEDADLGTANGPELTAVPETDDPLAESGQGLSPTPEGTSQSLPCGQQVVTPESSDSASRWLRDYQRHRE